MTAADHLPAVVIDQTGRPVAPRTSDHDPDEIMRLRAEWLVGYKSEHTRKAYARGFALWLNYCAASQLHPLHSVRRPHVEAWMRAQESSDPAPAESTVSTRVAAVSAFYGWCVQQDIVPRNPCLGIDRYQYDPDLVAQGGLTLGQLQQLLTAARDTTHIHGPRDSFAVHLMAMLGLRVGSLCSANLDDIRPYQGQRGITVPIKGGKRQFHPFNDQLLTAGDRYLEYLAKAPWEKAAVLVHAEQHAPRGRRPLFTLYDSPRRATRDSLGHALTRLAAEAGLDAAVVEAITPHWLRHTFVTLSLELGEEYRHVSVAAGHSTLGITLAYDQGRRAVKNHPTWKLGQALGG
jgi:integrase/recombinase XerD